MNMWTRIGLVALVAAALTAPASALTVDEFDSGAQLSASQPLGLFVAQTGGLFGYPVTENFVETGLSPDVLGGVRDIELKWLNYNHTGFGYAAIDFANGYLNFSNTSGVQAQLTATYDAGGTGFGGGSGVDFTDGGNSVSLLIRLLESDLGGDFQITVTDVDNDTAVYNKVAPAVAFGSTEVMSFDFDEFPNTGDINWKKITSVEYVFTAKDEGSGDYKISLLGTGTIPEPLTMLAVGSAIAGVGGYIRRRRRDA